MAKRDKLAGIVDPAKLQSPRRLPDPVPTNAGPAVSNAAPTVAVPMTSNVGPTVSNAPEPMKQRLPEGSTKHLVWDGQEWHGLFEVPDCPPFTATAANERGCYHRLDDAYRAHLKSKEPTDGVR